MKYKIFQSGQKNGIVISRTKLNCPNSHTKGQFGKFCHTMPVSKGFKLAFLGCFCYGNAYVMWKFREELPRPWEIPSSQN